MGALAGGLGCFPLDHGSYHPQSDSRNIAERHSKFGESWYPSRGPSLSSALPPPGTFRGYTQIYFGENQLSRNLISLSLLPTAHPKSFQPQPVRAFSARYRAFTLAMGRSFRFGSTTCNSAPCSDSLSLRLHLVRLNLTLHIVTRRLIMQKARGQTLPGPKTGKTVLPLLVSMRFQGLFHSPYRGTFHLSLTVLVHYRSRTTI